MKQPTKRQAARNPLMVAGVLNDGEALDIGGFRIEPVDDQTVRLTYRGGRVSILVSPAGDRVAAYEATTDGTILPEKVSVMPRDSNPWASPPLVVIGQGTYARGYYPDAQGSESLGSPVEDQAAELRRLCGKTPA